MDSLDLPMLDVQQASHHYGDIQALSGVSFQVPAGSFFALLGPNGAGKSTLVALLSTLTPLQGGQIRVVGHDVRRAQSRIRRELGLVFQEPSLDERLTVAENLDFHGRIYGMGRRDRQVRAREVLAMVELSDWEHALARILSRGMKRRLEIARAVMHRPRLLLLDEPTVGLDVQSRHALWRYLGALRQDSGLSLLLTTHQIEEAEGADLVAVIDRGELLRFGTPAELRAAHGREVVELDRPSAGLLTRLSADYPQEVAAYRTGKGSRLILRPGDSASLLRVLAEHAGEVGMLSVHAPSLEDVFLDLTGRGLREDRLDLRDATLAFARGGGEHTR